MKCTILILGLIIALVSIPSVMASPQPPYPLDGYIVDKAGATVCGANVTFTNLNTSEVIYADSDPTYGWYSQDAGNFTTDYATGQVIQYYTVFGNYTNTTVYTLNTTEGSHTTNITLNVLLDSDADGVPDAWDAEPNTPVGYWTDSRGRGRLFGDMNGDGKLSSVDALMILQMAVR